MLASKYIGIKVGSEESPGRNAGLIFVKRQDGLYQLEGRESTFTEAQISNDIEKNYLMEYEAYTQMVEKYGVIPETD